MSKATSDFLSSFIIIGSGVSRKHLQTKEVGENICLLLDTDVVLKGSIHVRHVVHTETP